MRRQLPHSLLCLAEEVLLPLTLCSSAYSVRSWESGFGCCWVKQGQKGSQGLCMGQAGQEQSWTCSALGEPKGPLLVYKFFGTD